jgi:hypothetical protein
VVFEPLELNKKLAALMPPGFKLVRYHGVASPAVPV